MIDAERLARLRLIRTPHVGPVSWQQLMQRFGSGEAAIVLWRHRENIARLRAGTEPRIGSRKKDAAE